MEGWFNQPISEWIDRWDNKWINRWTNEWMDWKMNNNIAWLDLWIDKGMDGLGMEGGNKNKKNMPGFGASNSKMIQMYVPELLSLI